MGKELRVPADRKRCTMGLCLVLMALRLLLSLGMQLLWPDMRSNAGHYFLAILLQEVLIWLLPALALLPWRTQRLAPKHSAPSIAMVCVVMGVLLQAGASLLQLLPWKSSSTMPTPRTLQEGMLALVTLLFVPAVCEEAFFRGAVTVHLMDAASPAWAFTLSTLVFALMHGKLIGLPAHLAVSACCTLAMMATGRVWPGMLLHLSYNASVLMVPMLPPVVCFAALAAAVGIAVMVAKRINWKAEGKHLGRVDAVLVCIVIGVALSQYLM